VLGTGPRTTALEIEQAKGPVSLSGVRGPLTVEHDHGPVSISGAASSVDVKIKNGDIQADFRSVPPGATVALRTANGDVTLGLPRTASAQLNVQTNVGVIQTKGLSLTNERFMPRNAGGQYTAQMGAGEASIEVQVQNGSITVRSADVGDGTEAPPADTVSTPAEGAAPPADTADPSPDAESVEADTMSSDTLGS
jgi:DUF4097 and DUF4098 domain-containing protein YvlB